MGIISVDTKYGPLEFEIKGDAPSVSEQLKIQDVLVAPEQYFSDEAIESSNWKHTQLRIPVQGQ